MTKQNITDRDGYIIMKALAYAIEAIDRLPKRWQEVSDRDDMETLLMYCSDDPTTVEQLRNGARSHLNRARHRRASAGTRAAPCRRSSG